MLFHRSLPAHLDSGQVAETENLTREPCRLDVALVQFAQVLTFGSYKVAVIGTEARQGNRLSTSQLSSHSMCGVQTFLATDDVLSRVLLCFTHPDRALPISVHPAFWHASRRSEAWASINLSKWGYQATDQTIEHALDAASSAGARVQEMELMGCIHLTDRTLIGLAGCQQLRSLKLDGTVGFRQVHSRSF